MELILVRGLPGSGKSTIAKLLSTAMSAKHLEADRYFETPNGYIFDASKLKEAHQWCYDACASYISTGKDVIVSNTFTTKQEMQQYLNLATKWKAKVTIVDMHNNFGSIHNVPAVNIKAMLIRWEHTRDIVCPNYFAQLDTIAAVENRKLVKTNEHMETPEEHY